CCSLCFGRERGTVHLSSGFSPAPVALFPYMGEAKRIWAASTGLVPVMTQGSVLIHSRCARSSTRRRFACLPTGAFENAVAGRTIRRAIRELRLRPSGRREARGGRSAIRV